jgi:anti-sigma factor ChrR (cupin superfamily)
VAVRDEGPDSKREAAELAAYADGSLPESRRAEMERRLARSPRLRALLAEQRKAIAATSSRREHAPAPLAEQVRSLRPPARRRRRGLAALALAGAVAAAVLAVVLALPNGEPSAPSFATAAVLSDRDPEAAAPDGARGEGLRYPDWAADYGWRTQGVRIDRIGNRRAATLFYSRRHRRVGYTIVSRPPLSPPGDSLRVMRDGRAFHRLRLDGRTLIVWERRGRTCILSGRRVPAQTLLNLAASRD